MTKSDNLQKLEQFNEFFTIEHEFGVNVSLLAKEKTYDYQSFINNMPTPFKMASDMSSLDQAALRPLQALSGVAGQLVDYLNHQAQKIDLLMGYILSQQIEEESHFQGVSFGGGGITFSSESSFNLGEYVELKVFIESDNCAVYCYGEIIEVNKHENGYQQKVIFHFIRDDDREILVRASLHKQSEQLKALSKKRNQTTS
ncbi:MAG: PilZ domain-containing protein [Colwelliaceae bacterium]|nr:PilZ domain-containing protein [Colwelliaceae bacterium]